MRDLVPEWSLGPSGRGPHVIGVVPGAGIGPEVVGAALTVLRALESAAGLRFEVRTCAQCDSPGRSGGQLAEGLAAFCDSIFSDGGTVLCGPAGGRFVYQLRERFDLYCKLVPLQPSPALADAAIVRPERLAAVDMLIVRENLGGLYFGRFGRRQAGRVAYQHCSYSADQVSRILAVAADLAAARRGKLSVVVKTGGIPEVSGLWCEQAEDVAAVQGIDVEVLEVDNASFQLIAQPQAFDVVAAPNMLGDVIADSATILLGSRGMSYSANFGPDGRAVYQTGHGAAHDLAGSDRANPAAQMLSLAMLLRETLGLDQAAARIESAIERVFGSGVRTQDVAGRGSRIVGTRELAECVAEEVAKHPPEWEHGG